MLRRGSAFNGFSLEATDGKVGTITDLLFDDSSWKLRWLVVDTGTWLSERKILIAPSALAKLVASSRSKCCLGTVFSRRHGIIPTRVGVSTQ